MTRKRLEWEIYESLVKLYGQVGCKVKRFAQSRASKQTPGIPDLKIFAPNVCSSWWHEVKTPAGTQSPAQREFQAEAQSCGEVVVVGGVEEAKAQLLRVGLAYLSPTIGYVLRPGARSDGSVFGRPPKIERRTGGATAAGFCIPEVERRGLEYRRQ